MPQQKHRHAARLRLERKPAGRRQIERFRRAVHLADHGEKRRRTRAFFHRPQAFLDPPWRHDDDPRGIEAETGKPGRIRHARLANDLRVEDPQQIAAAAIAKKTGQSCRKPTERTARPGFRRRHFMQGPERQARSGEKTVESLQSGDETGRPPPICSGSGGRRELRLRGGAPLDHRNAATQPGKEVSFRERLFHGHHDRFCSCYVLIDSAKSRQSQAVFFAATVQKPGLRRPIRAITEA